MKPSITKIALALIFFIVINIDDAFADDQTTLQQSARPHYCPLVSEITKSGVWWTARNGTWKNFNQSLSEGIASFIGAQWYGVRVGKITCLYLPAPGGDDFPIALEEVQTELVLEPKSLNWSAPVDGRKLCKSASVADCDYYVEQSPDIKNIYNSLNYKPEEDAGNYGDNNSY